MRGVIVTGLDNVEMDCLGFLDIGLSLSEGIIIDMLVLWGPGGTA